MALPCPASRPSIVLAEAIQYCQLVARTSWPGSAFPTHVGVKGRLLLSCNGTLVFPTHVGVKASRGALTCSVPRVFPTHVGVTE